MLACALSALAGYVDGIGFLHLGGLFVSFMSGNTTRLGIYAAEANWAKVQEAAALIALFVVGSGIGSLIVKPHGKYRQPLLLLVEAALLALAPLADHLGAPEVAIGAVVLAMGMENAFFQSPGSGPLGLTYVTGALVKVGHLMAAALTGGPRWAWLPNLLLWAALATGAMVGGLVYVRIQLDAVWYAAGVALAISVLLGLRRGLRGH
jgi:uncharacterized membrane protein YoaK (UPF0700 family)